ncbi:DUF2177 family protein [Bradyrhizobium sp. B124]|uniref:DUF2177 family protein n=2 Tax=Bradyrhizobium TaxID=374 RepID=UPI0031840E70
MPTFPYFYGISARFRPVPEVIFLTKISWGFLGPVAPNPQLAVPNRRRMIQTPRSVVTPLRAAPCDSGVQPSGPDMTYLYAYLSTLIVFLLCDMAWLGTMATRLYRPTLGDILSTEVNLPPAIAFYLIYPIGLVVFAVLPAIRSESLAQAALSGALFGFFSYMTYDLTNQATVRNWTFQLTLLDMTWGTLLGAMSATAACLITARLAA